MTGPAIEGRFHAAQSSRMVPARLAVPGNGVDRHLVVRGDDDESLAAAPFSAVAFGERIGSAPRRLHFPDGSVFETEDHDAVSRLEGRTRASRLHDWEAFRPRLLAVVAAGLAGVWLIWRYGLDIAVAGAIAMTPASMLRAMDVGTIQAIDRIMADPTELSDGEQARIRAIFADLVETLPEGATRDGQALTLDFRAMPAVGPNAFALPGGSIIMTDAFAREFGTEDTIAGVLGHEIGHVVEQHGLRQVYRSLGLYVLVALMAGDTGPLLESILLEGNLLLSLSFSRESELEADAFGVGLVRDAGYDPRGLADFFRKLSESYGDGSGWRSTHPSSDDRADRIEDMIKGN